MKPLLAKVRRCNICAGHLPHGVRPVLQAGARAKILIAGQAPGRVVHESGVPFSDASGRRLREWLGVTEDQFYDPQLFAILPMGFCYPGTGQSGDLPPRPECAPRWRAPLLRELPAIELTLILGQYALRWHCPEAGRSVTEAVQNWRQLLPTHLALPHPSPRNNGWLKKHPWFGATVLPRLRARVAQLLAATEPEG